MKTWRAALRRPLDRPAARVAAVGLLIAVAYYAGARLGLLLTFPSLTTSVLWPPNAILTAALLLSDPRRWWLYLLAALPAHLAVQLPLTWPTPLVLLLFVTNCSEALIAAVLVRRFAVEDRVDFDSLRSAGSFIVCAGLAAPFASSFLDAGVVTMLRGDEFWLVWRTRFFANVLTQLTLVPPLVMAVRMVRSARLRSIRGRLLEALVLGASLVLVSMVVWSSNVITGVVSPMVPLVLLLPFLAWAAMRLGPAGTSAAMLTVEIIAVVVGLRTLGPLVPTLSPLEYTLSLQIVLAVLAIPLMCFAALLEEHERTRVALEAQLAFEEKLSRLSRAFVHLPSEEIDAEIRVRLREFGEYFGAEHITIMEASPEDRTFVPTHAWPSPPSSRVLPALALDAPWRDLTELPFLLTDVCVVRFGAPRTGRSWPPDVMPQLRLVAEVLSNAIARRRAEEALRSTERLNTAILGSLSSSVAVVNRNGRVAAINPAWQRFEQGVESRGTVNGNGAGIGVGADVEALCHHALGGSPLVGEALAGIQAVIDGTRPLFTLEYSRPTPPDERWFAMAVLRLNRSEGGAVVSLTDITERRRVELDAQQTRQELAHFTRVSTMGELAASLAHELNQPLTGILANAQAAQRFLAARPPRLGEVAESLADIVADDQRAAEVIRRVRELLRKGNVQRVQLDLNLLIGEVVKLIAADALARQVAVELDLEDDLPPVRADRVQVQQVILNLLINAMEALSRTNGGAARMVKVCTRRGEGQSVLVTVRDTGPGLPPEKLGIVFEPFYTTKPDGMGMGLSIARSIVTSSGGRIWASNDPVGGVAFHFTLDTAAGP